MIWSPRPLLYCLLQRMGIFLFTISAMICLFVTVMLLFSPSQSLAVPGDGLNLQQLLPSYLQTQHQAWWGEPDYQASSSQADCKKDGWNVLYHLGGNGPWIEKTDDVAEGGIKVPEGCEVDMVHMMSRHAERYPTKNAGIRMIQMLERIKAIGKPFTGALEFVNSWEYFTNSPDQHFEQLTTTGPYAGVLEAFTTGVKLGTRYAHLWNSSFPNVTHLWASEAGRVIDTARHFSAGFFGLESKLAKVIVVSEAKDKGGDTLTPGDTCKKYVEDAEKGHDNGYTMLAKYQSTYLPAISTRLSIDNPGYSFTNAEIYSMQEMCGFETTVRGWSPWCDVFTHSEWRAFEYARDIIHFYRAGPGTPYSRAMGHLWLNATKNLLIEGSQSAGPLYFSFVHDGDIVPMLASLGLLEDEQDLPTTHIAKYRKWKTSQVTPMGGRVLFERLTCADRKFVRINVNDGIVPLPSCADGPGGSCELENFVEYIDARGRLAGDFRSVCGLPDDAAREPSFLRQPAFAKT